MKPSRVTKAQLHRKPLLERDGMWFNVHFVERGKVYFVKGKSGEVTGSGQQMPVDEFVRQYNAGRLLAGKKG